MGYREVDKARSKKIQQRETSYFIGCLKKIAKKSGVLRFGSGESEGLNKNGNDKHMQSSLQSFHFYSHCCKHYIFSEQPSLTTNSVHWLFPYVLPFPPPLHSKHWPHELSKAELNQRKHWTILCRATLEIEEFISYKWREYYIGPLMYFIALHEIPTTYLY